MHINIHYHYIYKCFFESPRPQSHSLFSFCHFRGMIVLETKNPFRGLTWRILARTLESGEEDTDYNNNNDPDGIENNGHYPGGGAGNGITTMTSRHLQQSDGPSYPRHQCLWSMTSCGNPPSHSPSCVSETFRKLC